MKKYKVTIGEDTVANLLDGAALLARALNDDVLCDTLPGVLKGKTRTIMQPHVEVECENAYTWLTENYGVISSATLLISETLIMVNEWLGNDEIRIVGNER